MRLYRINFVLTFLFISLFISTFPFVDTYAYAATPTANTNKMVRTNVSASSMVYDSVAGKVTFSKNVKVVHPDFTLTSQELVLYLAKDGSKAQSNDSTSIDAGKVERIVAQKNVKILMEGDRTGTCDKATYKVADETLTMEGSPLLTEKDTVIEGRIITFFVQQSKSEVVEPIIKFTTQPVQQGGNK